MVKIISFEPYKKNFCQVRFELSSGEGYVIGFEGQQPLENEDLYSKALERILNAFENGEEPDLSSYLSYRLVCEKLQAPLYVSPDRNGERERIGQRIREIRTARGMEAKSLARLSQIDAANVSRIEQGKYSVGLDILCRIALALDSRVDIVPNETNPDNRFTLSMTRRLWVIPTFDVHYDPKNTIPPCGFSLWPNTYNKNISIGDLVVFYNNSSNDYTEPCVVSSSNFRRGELGEHEYLFDNWIESEDDKYLKVDVCSLSEVDQIHIREAIRKIKEAPTKVVEVKL